MKTKKLCILFISVFLLVLPLTFSLSIKNTLNYNLNASKVNLTYDTLNRILQKNASTEQFNYSYDTKNGTLTNITHTKGIDKFSYDDKYRILTESRTINGIIFNKTYTYDASNRIISINLTSGTMLNYSYTNQSTLDNISGIINHTTHSVNNQPVNRTYNNSLHTIFVYNDTTLRLTSIETGTVADMDMLQNFTYSYDNTSNILRINDNANNMTYVMRYDDLNRLTYANRTGPTVPKTYEYNYSYDSIGNLLDVNGSSANISFTYTDTPVHAPKTITTMNFPPTHSTPILNSSNGKNLTIENLTIHSVDTFDNNFDDTKNIINWYRNSTSLLLLNIPMEGNSTVTSTRDYSGFNHTVNVWNATWFKDEGYDTFGAYNFSVDNNRTYMNISYNQIFNVSVWTIEAWVYPHTSYTEGGTIIAKWKPIPEQMQWLLKYVNGDIFRCSVMTFSGIQSVVSTAKSQKTWHHTACTYDGSNITLYVDGNKESTLNVGVVRNNDAEIQIGARATDKFFNGTIDDVKIWNYSLTWQQINNSYNNRTDIIDQSITEEADLWQATVTPNDKLQDGSTFFTNTLRIRSSPTQDDVVLNSTYEMNWTTENLTIYNTSTFDNQNDKVKNIIVWYRNNTPMLLFSAPMEGASNTTATKDYGGYNMSITVVNASWSNSSGYDGFGAYNFSEVNPTNKTFLNVSHHQALNLTSWTMLAWVYPHSIDPTGGVIIGKFQQWQMGYAFNNRYRCGVNNASNSFISITSRSSGGFVKNWSHVVCVFNGTNLTMYVNGNYENSTHVGGGGFVSSKELQIGARNADQFFNGSIDDVQIWNGTLTWEQINYSFNNRTDMLAWSMTREGETWNATISPNDRSKDGEIRTSKALLISRLAEIVISEGTETMNSTTYNTTLTVINEPVGWFNSTNYNTTLGWTVYG